MTEAPHLESNTNYFMVGLTVLTLVAGLLIFSLWLSTGFDKKSYHFYTVYMSEPVSGLTNDSPVKYNGVKVGFINEIELNKNDPQRVKLTLSVEEDTPITADTKATLISQGITGTTYLGLTASAATSAPLVKAPGEDYPVIPYKPSFFFLLEQNVTEITTGMNRVFDKENALYIKKSLDNIQKISSIIEQNNLNLNESLKNLPILIAEIKNSANQFSKMSHDISAAGFQLSDTMRAGRNSIDKVSQQAIPAAVTLLNRLNLIAANLEKVSSEMRQNPAVILRGSTPPKPGPGESP